MLHKEEYLELRTTADKMEIKDFPKWPSTTSLIRITLAETGILTVGGGSFGYLPI
jgi:hypothetical protein